MDNPWNGADNQLVERDAKRQKVETEISSYEMRRLENIRRNKEMLQSLGLRQPSPRKLDEPKKEPKIRVLRDGERRSDRLKVIPPPPKCIAAAAAAAVIAFAAAEATRLVGVRVRIIDDFDDANFGTVVALSKKSGKWWVLYDDTQVQDEQEEYFTEGEIDRFALPEGFVTSTGTSSTSSSSRSSSSCRSSSSSSSNGNQQQESTTQGFIPTQSVAHAATVQARFKKIEPRSLPWPEDALVSQTSKRSKCQYMNERAAVVSGKTVNEILAGITVPDKHGGQKNYTHQDLKYDCSHGLLTVTSN